MRAMVAILILAAVLPFLVLYGAAYAVALSLKEEEEKATR